MGQLNKQYEVLDEELKEIGESALKSFYSSEEIVSDSFNTLD